MTDYNAGVLKVTANERLTWQEDPYDELPDGVIPAHTAEDFLRYNGVITIDGEVRKWTAYSAERYSGSSNENYIVEYGYKVRVDLAGWRKRKDVKAIRTAVSEAITAERQRLDAEGQQQ